MIAALFWDVWVWRAYCIYAFGKVWIVKKFWESYLQLNKGIILIYAVVLQASYCFLKDESIKESVYITSRERGFTQLFLFWKDLEGVDYSSLSPFVSSLSLSHVFVFSILLLQTSGGLRDPSDYEIRESPHGSFTKVTFPFSSV